MIPQDRKEVREMIHDTLSGWNALITSQNDIINNSLERIEKHLETINGEIIGHAKIINSNLPHSIAHCSQTSTIEEIKTAIVGTEAIKKIEELEKAEKNAARTRWILIIGIVVTILLNILNNTTIIKRTIDLDRKVDQINIPVKTRGGEILMMPSGIIIDSLNEKINH